jgi:Zn-dependent alcohol dehydrogenase
MVIRSASAGHEGDKLLTRRYPIEQINEAYEAMLGGEVARSVVTFAP